MSFCVHCGRELVAGTAFCADCGTPVQGAAPHCPSEAHLTEQKAKAIFVGSKYPYFETKWSVLELKNGSASWNWSAFFWSFMWMAYRKMYAYAALFIGIMVVESLVEYNVFGDSDRFSGPISIAISVVFGLYGNRWYKTHVERNVRDLMGRRLTQNETVAALARRGGTSIAAAAGFLVILFACGALLVGATEGFG